jgi:hypothetical protein
MATGAPTRLRVPVRRGARGRRVSADSGHGQRFLPVAGGGHGHRAANLTSRACALAQGI